MAFKLRLEQGVCINQVTGQLEDERIKERGNSTYIGPVARGARHTLWESVWLEGGGGWSVKERGIGVEAGESRG